MKLKLQRRMIVSEMSSERGVVTIAGRVVGPFTSPMQKVLVKRRVTCRDWKVVKRFRPNPDGTFRVRLKAPKDGEAAVYRYAVNAEAAPGDRDLAPNSGLVQHRLGGGGAAGVTGARTASSAPAAPAPAPPAASAAPAPAPVAAAAPASPAKTSLPRTGPGEPPLLPLSGLALMTGGALVALGARRSRIRRSEVTGGIR